MAWRQWRRFAHRAAEVQSRVLLFLMYFVFVVPIAAVMRIGKPAMKTRSGAKWHSVPPPPETLSSAKNQF